MNRLQFISTLLCIPKGVKEVFKKNDPYQALLDERVDLSDEQIISMIRHDKIKITQLYGIKPKQLAKFHRFALSRKN